MSSTIQKIFEMCNGLVNLDELELIDPDKHIYKNPKMLFGDEVYYRGLVYTELVPEGAFKETPDFREQQLKTANNFYETMERLKKKGEWTGIFGLIDKRIGLTKFIKHLDDIPQDKIYDTFIEIYTRSEFGFEILKNHYHKIFSYAQFSKKRQERLNLLAKKLGSAQHLTIFHGDSISYPVYDYYSWTLNVKTAQFFAIRHGGVGEVWGRLIKRDEAIDYLTGRGEEEILYDYEPEKEDGATAITLVSYNNSRAGSNGEEAQETEETITVGKPIRADKKKSV